MDESHRISRSLKSLGKVMEHHWRHWDVPHLRFDIDKELDAIEHRLTPLDDIYIVAKSIGTFVAMHLLPEFGDQVAAVLLMGIPIYDLEEGELEMYEKTLGKSSCKKYILMNEDDPHGTADEVKQLLRNVKLDKFIVQSGIDNHRYDYPEDILDLVESTTNLIEAEE